MANQRCKKIFFGKKTRFFKRTEEGNVVDLMAGVLMMVCLFALILAMLAYSALVERRLAINNAVRNYLFIAEQQGGLTKHTDGSPDDGKTLIDFLVKNYGASDVKVYIGEHEYDAGGPGWINDHGASGHEMQNIPYGTAFELKVEMQIPNPLYQVLGASNNGDKYWFKVGGLSHTIPYTISLSSTSRW